MAQANHSNGRLFRICTESPVCIGYLLIFLCPPSVPRSKGALHAGGHKKKSCSILRCCSRISASVFRLHLTRVHFLRTLLSSVFWLAHREQMLLHLRPTFSVSQWPAFAAVLRFNAYSCGTAGNFTPFPHPAPIGHALRAQDSIKRYELLRNKSTTPKTKSQGDILGWTGHITV